MLCSAPPSKNTAPEKTGDTFAIATIAMSFVIDAPADVPGDKQS